LPHDAETLRKIVVDLGKLHQYLLELQPQVLPKSPSGAAVRYALNQWDALTRFLEDGELEIDNGATERANRDIALGRGNWTFFGSDSGGKMAAVLRSFVASCKRCSVEPFAWFNDVLSRIPAHSIARLPNCFPTTGNRRLPLLRLDNSRWQGSAA
jgi:transposase